MSQRKKKKKANRILRNNPCAYRGRCQQSVSGCCLRPTDSLSAAIGAASPGATIRLCPGTWTLTGVGATLSITKDITLIGAGGGQTILDGSGIEGGNNRTVLRIDSGSTVTIQGLTITKGIANSGGGGIYNSGTLTLVDVTVTDNHVGYEAGGIYNAGTLTLKKSSVTGNSGDFGGGIYNSADGTLWLQDGSRVAGNTASSDGGGIYFYAVDGREGRVTIDPGAVVCGNSPDDCGGGPITGTCPQLPPSGVCPV